MSSNTSNPLTRRSLPIALLRSRERVMGPIRGMLADAGVTEQQWRVLRVLDEEGPMDPTSISDRAVLLLPSLTRILQKLEDKGYVTRKRDETDRRRQIIAATDAGKNVIAENMHTSRRILSELREKMGEEEHDQLIDLLIKLTDLED